MNKRPYNTESIRQYLLGTLSDAETERLDELSFMDDEFVDAVNAVERDLIDSYVQLQLPNSLSTEFEARYLASPLKREKVELARVFYESGDSNAAFDISTKSTSDYAARPTLFSFARWRWQWGLSGIASLILAFVAWSVFVSLRQNAPTEQSPSSRNSPAQQQNPASVKSNEPSQARTPEVTEKTRQGTQQSVAQDHNQQQSSSNRGHLVSVILSPQMRGTTNIPIVAIPAKAEDLAIRLELEPNDYSTYRVVLRNENEGVPLWRSRRMFGQTKDGSKTLSIHLPLQRIKPRLYVLQVYGLTENGRTEQMSDYHFRVLK
ncbi:MAG TPA: hypothetical protein VGQ39_23000 [Pyrinomonadaceae bacterium]|jgi:hypothetical protein|nr:hypothetical protein [Pyrinomonadaceae bacterium]